MSTESWVVAAPQTLEVGDVRALSVKITGGRAEVVASPARESGAVVEVLEVGPRPLHVLAEDGALSVAYDFSGVEGLVDRVRGLRDSDRAVVRVTVPAHVPVRVGTVGAEAVVTGTAGETDVRTVDGGLHVTGTTGRLRVRTVSGDIAVGEHAGDVNAQAVSGHVTVAGRLGRVTAQTVSGRVEVVADGTTPLVTAKTVSGGIAVRLAPGTVVNLRARGVTGRVVVDGVDVPSTARSTVSVDHVEPGAGAYVSASTVSGSVTVSRS